MRNAILAQNRTQKKDELKAVLYIHKSNSYVLEHRFANLFHIIRSLCLHYKVDSALD